jgi:acyl-CoA synthetase (AMP-forming)/AMP-acid ligase II
MSSSDVGEPRPDAASLERQISECCSNLLASYKVPAIIRFVDSLEMSAAGKLVRQNA